MYLKLFTVLSNFAKTSVPSEKRKPRPWSCHSHNLPYQPSYFTHSEIRWLIWMKYDGDMGCCFCTKLDFETMAKNRILYLADSPKRFSLGEVRTFEEYWRLLSDGEDNRYQLEIPASFSMLLSKQVLWSVCFFIKYREISSFLQF